jgi:hypothetical protein
MTDRAHSGQEDQLKRMRREIYDSFVRWSDALFELTDALLSAPGAVGSVPALSLEPVFRRSHGSLYKALSLGEIDADALRATLVAHRPKSWPAVFAVDASTWERCDAECSPERGFYHPASKHSAGQPIVAGWSYQWVAQLNFYADSWTAPLDVMRIPPSVDATDATIAQIKRLVAALKDGGIPLFVFDAGYDPAALTHGLKDDPVQILVRIREDRVFHADPPTRPKRPTGTAGRPPRHGRRMKCSEPNTHPKPDAEHHSDDPRYGTVRVRAWHNLHPRLHGRGRWNNEEELPIVRASVICVEVEHLPKNDGRAKKTLWLWWSGPGEPDLELCFRAYLHRFDLEHTFRFIKNTLGWTAPSLCTPHQADRWTWLIASSYTQLRMARGLVDDLRLPWERPCDPAKLTPARVRRGFRRLRATLGSPANPPKSDTPGPGRPKGTRRPPRTRHPVIKKAA